MIADSPARLTRAKVATALGRGLRLAGRPHQALDGQVPVTPAERFTPVPSEQRQLIDLWLPAALTEDWPTIKPYDEALWAKLSDSQETPIAVSLTLLEALHKRWITLLRGMHPEDFARRLKHPERGTMTLDDALTTYSWHGKHHVAHITSLRHRMSW